MIHVQILVSKIIHNLLVIINYSKYFLKNFKATFGKFLKMRIYYFLIIIIILLIKYINIIKKHFMYIFSIKKMSNMFVYSVNISFEIKSCNCELHNMT